MILIKFAIKAITVIAFAGLLLIACQSLRTKTKQRLSQQIEFADVEAAGSFDVPLKGTAIITNEAEWNEWWIKYWNLFSGSGQKTPPPAVDFEKKMVIAMHWGAGYSGCSNKVDAIERIQIINDSLNVVVKSLPFLGPCDMEVFPLQMVEIARSNLPVKFSGSFPERTNRKIY
ncbi:MAG: hypothetical protein AMJ53_00270 [Gammaproteobacteria bacterium SG8_11]|nr:MAG: hypothetical protein AMJ53_00270 [Gammaproteobacteria bacterium SG8_11]